ncbi:MAG TPA: hypothetical protein PKC18_01990 [Lacipirellulaceae bacterium]|nr:hypothetical protein [Lacipirellulaceae bacterium]
MNDHSTKRLAELVGNRRRCLEQLLNLGRRQVDLVSLGNMSDLMRLLAAKQQLIAALQSLEKELAPFHEQEPDDRVWESSVVRSQCAADADACRRLILEVVDLEQGCEKQITFRRDEAASKLRNVESGSMIRAAYSKHD